MDLAKLQQTIGTALSGTDFSLAGSAFGPLPSPVDSLFAALFGPAPLKLSGAKADVTGSPVTAHGVLTSVPTGPYAIFAGFTVDASFSLDAKATAQLTLRLTAPVSWSLTDLSKEYAGSLLSAFEWTGSAFVFDTASPAALPSGFPETFGFPVLPVGYAPAPGPGAVYSGKLVYSGTDTGLKLLLGNSPLDVTGSIIWHADNAEFDLATAPLQALTIGSYSLPVTFHGLSIILPSVKPDTLKPAVQNLPLGALTGKLGLPTGSQPLDIPFVIDIYGQPVDQLRVAGNFSAASKLALQDIAALLDTPSLSHAQSPDFPALDGLELKSIELLVDTRTPSLLSASAKVDYTPPNGAWEPFGPKLLTFEGMAVTFTVLDPMSAPSFETVIDCTLGLAGGELDAQLSLPSLAFCCELEDGETHPIDLTEVLDGLTGNAFTQPTPGFKLLCTQLKVLGDKSAGYYRFQATIKDNWVFSVDGSNFALEQIGFDITRQETGTAATTGQVVATFLIANVEAQISATYTGDAAGWQFSGCTLPDQSIALSDLVADSLAKFGLSLPGAVPKITLTQLEMMVTTGTLDFGFSCAGSVEIAGTVMNIGIDLGRTHDNPAKPADVTTTFMGYLEVEDQYFEIDFATGPTDKSITAKWIDEGPALEFSDIAKAFGFKDVPEVPSSLKLSLTEASFTYDFNSKILILTAKSKTYGAAVFVGDGASGSTTFFGFGIDLDLGVTLADLPLVGDKIPDADQLGIPSAGIWILSNTLAKAEVTKVNSLIAALKVEDLPTLPDEDLTARVLMHAMLKIGMGEGRPLVVSLGSSAQPQKRGTGPRNESSGGAVNGNMAGGHSAAVPGEGMSLATKPSSPGDTSTKWISIQRQFGIFNFNRIGVRYHDNTLYFVFDAGMTMGPLSLSMDGLAIGSPLTDFVPKFDISGLGLGYNKPPLEIEGALLKLPDQDLSPATAFQFDGLATVKAESFSLSAIGSYAQSKAGDPSLFVFAQLEAPLGDPTGTGALFVTGLMGGFGFNRNLKIPEQDQVQGFPLLLLAQPPTPGQKAAAQDPMFVLDVLEGRQPAKPGGVSDKWIEPSPGDYWLGVGLEFTSWELVQTKALLIVEFGTDLTFALLGLSTMQLPQPGESSETYAFVQLQLRAVFKPQDGVFALSAVLSDTSYVLTPDCHLTGGFAFNLWFEPSDDSGQFVITLGGYHPAFKPPKYFPAEPRLGFNWAVSSTVSVKGGAYFALTPSCIMAGGSLEILFHDGDLRAWFTAHADLLVSWRPFFFIAEISIDIGVSYRLNLLFCHKTISVSLGADLKLWGPPTGGAVKIHVVVVSFTVHFGSDGAAANYEPLGWTAFSEMLPHPDHVCRITVQSGLHASPPNQGPSGKLWIVRARDFRFRTQSAIPAGTLTYANGHPPAATLPQGLPRPPDVHIRPMNQDNVTSTHNLTIYKDASTTAHDMTGWSLKPATANVPETLWGQPSKPFQQIPDKPSASVLDGRMTGFDVTAPKPKIGVTLGLVPLKALAQEYLAPSGTAPLNKAAKPSSDFVPAAKATSIADIQKIMDTPVKTARENLFRILENSGLKPGANDDLSRFVQGADHLFSAAPMVQT